MASRHAAGGVPAIPLLRTDIEVTEKTNGLICFDTPSESLGQLRVDQSGKDMVKLLVQQITEGVYQIQDLIAVCAQHGLEPRKTKHLLSHLYEAGICVDLQDAVDYRGRIPVQARQLLRKWAVYTSRPGLIFQMLKKSPVAFYDDTGFGKKFSRHLIRCGVSQLQLHQPTSGSVSRQFLDAVQGSQLTVAASTHKDSLLEINRHCLQNNVPFLPVQFCPPNSIIAGPLVRPHESACFACATSYQESTGSLAFRTHLRCSSRSKRRFTYSRTASLWLAELIIDSLAGCQEPPRLLNRTITMPPGVLPKYRSVLRMPRCPACGRANMVPEGKIISREGAANVGQTC